MVVELSLKDYKSSRGKEMDNPDGGNNSSR